MSEYKLTYFDARGLGEPIRFIFAISEVNYEDSRIPLEYEGGVPVVPQVIPLEIKQKCPWGQVPILEFEGKTLAQSLAIARFLAKKYNLTGADEFEAAKCDEYVDTFGDFFKEFRPFYMEQDPKKKADLAEKIVEEILAPKYFSKLEGIVEGNGGKYLVGKQLTWADLHLVAILNSITIISNFDITKFPNLKELYNNVLSLPQIKSWIEKRPKTEF